MENPCNPQPGLADERAMMDADIGKIPMEIARQSIKAVSTKLRDVQATVSGKPLTYEGMVESLIKFEGQKEYGQLKLASIHLDDCAKGKMRMSLTDKQAKDEVKLVIYMSDDGKTFN